VDYVPLCEAWPAEWCEGQQTVSVTGAPLMAASEALWMHSGRRYGSCEATIRPCRAGCSPAESQSRWWWDVNTWPAASPYGWWWLDAICGRCGGGCGCSDADELWLPVDAQSIQSVVIDGETLPASGYAFYDGRRLVRTDGERWPLCQDWAVPLSGLGAWSITPVFGRPVPVLGQMAVAELASEMDRACQGDGKCRLTGNVESITRGGVVQRFIDPAKLREQDLMGLPLANRFLSAVNPAGIRTGPRIWNPDDMTTARQPGGVS
jgi:hypothetical protein